MIRSIFYVSFFLIVSCGLSEKESQYYDACIQSSKYLDMYLDGEHISKGYFGRTFIRDVCRTKIKLFSNGYRISVGIKKRDLEIYKYHLLSDRRLKPIYIEAIQNGVSL